MTSPVAIVTGSSRGIGLAIAMRLLADGYAVCVVSNEKDELEAAFDQVTGKQLLIISGDLTDLGFAESLVDQCLTAYGRIDVLVNNAAWRTIETLRTMAIKDWEKTIRICLTVPAFLAKWVSPHMEKAGSGVIVNIASIMANLASGTGPAYVASKGGLLSLTYELAALLGPSGIRVVAVSPGNVMTEFSSNFVDEKGENISEKLIQDFEARTPLLRSGIPKEVADAVAWICSSEAAYITGTNLIIDGGYTQNLGNYQLKKIQFPNQF